MAEEEDKDGWTEVEVDDQPNEDKEELEIETPVSEDVSLAVKIMKRFGMRRTNRNSKE